RWQSELGESRPSDSGVAGWPSSAGKLSRFAADATAAGHYGETLITLASLVGEPQEHVLAVISTIPNVETRILDELDAASLSRQRRPQEEVSADAGRSGGPGNRNRDAP